MIWFASNDQDMLRGLLIILCREVTVVECSPSTCVSSPRESKQNGGSMEAIRGALIYKWFRFWYTSTLQEDMQTQPWFVCLLMWLPNARFFAKGGYRSTSQRTAQYVGNWVRECSVYCIVLEVIVYTEKSFSRTALGGFRFLRVFVSFQTIGESRLYSLEVDEDTRVFIVWAVVSKNSD